MATTVITELPLFTDSIYRYGATIEGQQKQFTFYWNARTASWHMDIKNEDQTEVVSGVALVSEYPMLADHPMEQFLLSGYFVLLPAIAGTPPPLDSSLTVIPESYSLFYVYIRD